MLGVRMHRSVLLAQAEAEGAVDGEPVVVESLGRRLRMQREALQLDVQVVCEKLHVRCAVIEALEADDYACAGTPMVYLRGYARNYVRLLNPEEPRLQAWLDEVAQMGLDTSLPSKRRGTGALRGVAGASIRPWFNPRWLLWLGIVLVVLGVVFLLQPSSPSLTSSQPPSAPPAAVEATQDVTMITPEPASASVTNEVADPKVTAAPVAAVMAAQSTATTQAALPRGTLRLEFTDRSWTQVEDGLGRVLEKRTVEAGSTNRYEGVLPFRVTLGNAVYVRVYFNDQEYDHLNDITDNNIARFQLGAPTAQ